MSFRSQAIDEDEDEDEDDEGAGKGEKWETVDRGGLEKPKMFDKDAEINHENVLKKLQEIMAARGKKRTNRKEQISLLNELHDISQVRTFKNCFPELSLGCFCLRSERWLHCIKTKIK